MTRTRRRKQWCVVGLSKTYVSREGYLETPRTLTGRSPSSRRSKGRGEKFVASRVFASDGYTARRRQKQQLLTPTCDLRDFRSSYRPRALIKVDRGPCEKSYRDCNRGRHFDPPCARRVGSLYVTFIRFSFLSFFFVFFFFECAAFYSKKYRKS